MSNQLSDPAFTGWIERVDAISREHAGLPASEFEPDLRRMYDAGATPEGFVFSMMEDFDLEDIALNPWTGQGGLQELGEKS
jgi:hypothetical protein